MTVTLDAYVILPDGRLELDTTGVIPPDVELEPIVFPEVSKEPRVQSHYESERLAGLNHDHAIINVYCARFGELPTHLPTLHARMRYREMRLAGESHSMAEMLATRTFPGIKTDAIFNERKFSSDSGLVGAEQTWLRAQAESAGVSTNGKWYCRGLASFPGDPTAWVGDRGDVLRIAREKNMTVHGYVEHKGHEVDPGGDIDIAEDLLSNEVQDIMDSNPGANFEEVQAKVHELRTGRVDPNPLRVEDSGELP